ncbi:cytochrome P450 77A2 [Amborella trichopoda]|uniref:Cytochrome P450 n=1 Tax=Amborella trichopoda TaxID=13333 RepID=W1PYM1_AMBTC|nr:cytochrome P450 77A2 [Amborella trichopoda]ERN13159.1 hypothetical protein AMTR_s00040p00200250 [Amborella trichopoda]|eukprot:XP_006851629.1 cytochrome P450 77A2 [Amborella trichopoda]
MALLYLFSILSALLFCYLFLSSRKTKALKLPPGPKGWPLVGNLLQIARSGKPFVFIVNELSQKYGPIFTLKMGARTLIVISSAELAHEALIQKGQTFANRPAETPTRAIFSSHKKTVNSAEYGPLWRSLRRNMVQGMLTPAKLRAFRPIRRKALDKLVERLAAESKSGLVRVLSNCRFTVFRILLCMCFGVEMDENMIEKVDSVLKKVLITLEPRIDDFLPILQAIFVKKVAHAKHVRKEQLETLLPLIRSRKKTIQNAMSAEPAYIDSLFDLDMGQGPPSEDMLVTLCAEFLNGGTDTTATAVEWAMAHLVADSEIQTRVRAEIDRVSPDHRVNDEDVEKMEYLQAFVKETLRKHPPTYFLLTHAVTEKSTLGGYDIPEGVNVDFYTPSISDDPKLWGDPERFRPERFVDKMDGDDDADLTGVKGVKMMPFGVGRRICPGLGLGMLHISLMVATMVQQFEWLPNPAVPRVDMSEKFEFTVLMKTPLLAIAQPRKK